MPEFFETYKEDIIAFFEALVEFFKTIIANLTAKDEEAAQ